MVTKPKQTSVLKIKTAAPLLKRAAVFLLCFILLSGVLGPRIISHGLVGYHGFEVYGGAGKALLFMVLCLLLLMQRSRSGLLLMTWRYRQALWLVVAALAAVLAWISINHLIDGQSSVSWTLLSHVGIILSVLFSLLGVFGVRNLIRIYKSYKQELFVSLGLGASFYLFLLAVYGLWGPLAIVVLHSVKWLLSIAGLQAFIIPPRTLLLSKFGITIAEYCSGIESIALFTGLYALIGVLDWRRFNTRRYLLAFPAALLILFGFNILRVFGLILGGYYINQEIAFSLFHTYAGMVFFILYSGLFWGLFYKHLLTQTDNQLKTT